MDATSIAEPFGPDYAAVYDHLYHDKDYAAECDLLERLFVRELGRAVHEVLDLGCGTGRHAELLADRGYRVLGVDRSPHMIQHARRRAHVPPSPGELEYRVADLRTFRTDRRFDAALMMFAVLGYQLEDADVRAALRTARFHLREGGWLLLDCWYGPAVLHTSPADRTKTIDRPQGRLTRTGRAEMDLPRRRIHIHFGLHQSSGTSDQRSQEDHSVRFFFRPELEDFLGRTGFSLRRVGAMPDFERDPDDTTWNILVLARADGGLTSDPDPQ